MPAKSDRQVDAAYKLARQKYARYGVDVDAAMKRLARVPISLHCWQGDDVGGFERSGQLDGGLAATGNYPGKARTPEELRGDLEMALRMLPGRHRVNLHAIYAETGGLKVDRNELGPKHFAGWIDWAKANRLGLDFNPTFFSHPHAASGLTLSHADKGIRQFWVEHGIASRKIAAAMGKALGSACVCNVWIPDGYKDTPADRLAPRQRLEDSLDRIFAGKASSACVLDAVEGKLFGIGSESYVVGSHEFYFGYAVTRQKLLTLDMGHYHPTESVADKITAAMLYVPEILLHVSRGVRWDSDHAVVLDDELKSLAQQLVRHDYLGRTHIGLDYFDASINRVAAYVIGARSMLKALLMALLEPWQQLQAAEQAGDFTARLALAQEFSALPSMAVWDYYCQTQEVPVGDAWLTEVKRYERTVMSERK